MTIFVKKMLENIISRKLSVRFKFLTIGLQAKTIEVY